MSPKKILVVKRDALGDIISVTPFLEVLRKAYPDAHITYLVGSWSKAVLQNNPNIDDLVVTDSDVWKSKFGIMKEGLRLISELKPGKFDTVFILQGPAYLDSGKSLPKSSMLKTELASVMRKTNHRLLIE